MFTLSWNDFLAQAKEFVKLSDQYDDHWNLVEKDEQEGNTYLTFSQRLVVSLDNQDDENDLTDLETHTEYSESNLQEYLSICKVEPDEDVVDIEYHIVFSISYQVPIMYFRAHRRDGKYLGLEEAWVIFRDPTDTGKSRNEMLSTITQSDHPVMFKPFFLLHPCRTAELLSQMGPSKNSVVTFISLIGPFVGLNLRNEYGLAFHDK